MQNLLQQHAAAVQQKQIQRQQTPPSMQQQQQGVHNTQINSQSIVKSANISSQPMQTVAKRLAKAEKKIVDQKFVKIKSLLPSILNAIQMLNSNPLLDTRGVGKRLFYIVCPIFCYSFAERRY